MQNGGATVPFCGSSVKRARVGRSDGPGGASGELRGPLRGRDAFQRKFFFFFERRIANCATSRDIRVSHRRFWRRVSVLTALLAPALRPKERAPLLFACPSFACSLHSSFLRILHLSLLLLPFSPPLSFFFSLVCNSFTVLSFPVSLPSCIQTPLYSSSPDSTPSFALFFSLYSSFSFHPLSPSPLLPRTTSQPSTPHFFSLLRFKKSVWKKKKKKLS